MRRIIILEYLKFLSQWCDCMCVCAHVRACVRACVRLKGPPLNGLLSTSASLHLSCFSTDDPSALPKPSTEKLQKQSCSQLRGGSIPVQGPLTRSRARSAREPAHQSWPPHTCSHVIDLHIQIFKNYDSANIHFRLNVKFHCTVVGKWIPLFILEYVLLTEVEK